MYKMIFNKVDENKFNNASLTDGEKQCLNWFMEYGLWNDEYGFSDIDPKDIADGIEEDIKIVRGYLGSLTKKDYIYIDEFEKNNFIVYLTTKGYKLYNDEYIKEHVEMYW